jgi:outer membrane lipoprotein SlyB
MRIIITLALAATALAATPTEARRHYYNGYRSHTDCRTDKRNAGHQGIAIGAIAGGAGTALLGGGVGTSLLGAAAGGTAGSLIGRGTEHCADRYHAH